MASKIEEILVEVSIFLDFCFARFFSKLEIFALLNYILRLSERNYSVFFSILNRWVLNWEIILGELKIKTIRNVCEANSDFISQISNKVPWIWVTYAYGLPLSRLYNNLPILDNISAPVSNSLLCMANILTKGNKSVSILC